ncbi:MAG TPA: hypothetical protein VJB35_04700 [Candidatus Nanoarchaeia archaeon]|nr:hypothetical protein [Candidatus Nanoarchaeia archaeon]
MMIANLEFYNEFALNTARATNTISTSEKEVKTKIITSLKSKEVKSEKEKIDLSKYNNMEMKAEIISYKLSSN